MNSGIYRPVISGLKIIKDSAKSKLLFILTFCFPFTVLFAQQPDEQTGYSWFVENKMVLGHQVQMLDENRGYAVSRGMGKNIEGKVYEYRNGIWKPIRSYPYSDFPLLKTLKFRGQLYVWAFNHLTHYGNYQPLVHFYNGRGWQKQTLPEIMWDEIDYSMFLALDGNRPGNLWAVGQKGNILHYDGQRWQAVPSPLKWNSGYGTFDFDLNAVEVIADDDAWAVGNKGHILHFDGKSWQVYTVFVRDGENRISDVQFLDTNTGWAVNKSGALLIFENGKWSQRPLNSKWQLTCIKVFSKDDIWLGGAKNGKSLLVHLQGGEITEFPALQALNTGPLEDIDGFYYPQQERHKLWLCATDGIITNSNSRSLTFSDVTARSNLPSGGYGAIFTDLNDDEYPDIVMLSDGQSPYRLYLNSGKASFTELQIYPVIRSADPNCTGAALGDVENDGLLDMVLIDDNRHPVFFRQVEPFVFKMDQQSSFEAITFRIESWPTLRFWDYNKDSYPDLLVAADGLPVSVCLNDGFGKFSEKIELDIPVQSGKRLIGITPYDFNVDNNIDLLLTYNLASTELWLNMGEGLFRKVDDDAFDNFDNNESFTGVFSDFNRDRWPDFFIYSRRGEGLIYSGRAQSINPEKRFLRFPVNRNHYYWSAAVASPADINHDYYPDLYISSGLFLNISGRSFKNISATAQASFEGHPSWADFDLDGDEDLLLGSSEPDSATGRSLALLQNNLERKYSIRLRFECSRNNYFGIGSWIWLFNSNEEYLTSVLNGFEGSTVLPRRSSIVSIPVATDTLYNVHIRFPDGSSGNLTGISPGKIYTVHDENLFARIFSKFLWSLHFTSARADWLLESLKFLVFLAALYLVLVKIDWVAVKSRNSKRVFTLIALLIYFAVFIVNGIQPYTARHWLVFAAPVLLVTLLPYIGGLIWRQRRQSVIAGYRILSEIGEGGMGKVYKARDRNRRIVALKLLHRGITESEEGLKRFQRECEVGAKLKHDNIVHILDSGIWYDQSYLVMEYLDGISLRDLIKEKAPLPVRQITRTGIAVARALTEMHRHSIVHRDVKSDNVFITGTGQIKLMDFGLAKSAIFTVATKTNVLLGTLCYMSPQQAVGEEVDHRSDLYSLGVVLYEMATGRLPFVGQHDMALIFEIFKNKPQPIREFRPDFPEQLEQCIFKAMCKEVEDRFQSADDIILELQKINNALNNNQSNYLPKVYD